MLLRPALAITLLTILWGNLLGAQTVPEIDVSVIRGGSSTEVDNEHVKALALKSIGQLTELSGLSFTNHLSIVVCLTGETFDSYAGSFGANDFNDVLGLYIPPELDTTSSPRASIALNLGRLTLRGSAFAATLKHEVLHALMHDNIRPHLRPLWFEEGLAQYVSESPMEEVLDAHGYISGQGSDPTSLSHLSMMLRTPSDRAMAYGHALAAVQEMEGSFGDEKLWSFVQALAERSQRESSDTFDEVFGRVFGRPFATWEKNFIEQRTRSIFQRIGAWSAANLFSVSMGLCAVLLIIAVIQRRRRDEGWLRRWREEDKYFPPDPSWAATETPEEDVDSIVARSLEEAERPATQPARPIPKQESDDEFSKGRWTESGWVADDS